MEGGFGAVGHGNDFCGELGSGIEEDGFFGESGQGVEVDAGLSEAVWVMEIEIVLVFDHLDVFVVDEVG